MRLIIKTVTLEAPGPFTDAEAEAFIAQVELSLDGAIEAAIAGTIDAARAASTPLADVVVVRVSD